MQIRLHDPNLLDDLSYFFERGGFIVEQQGRDAVDVLPAEAMDPKTPTRTLGCFWFSGERCIPA